MATTNSSSRILLACDFPMLRDSLKSHFDAASNIEIVGCANHDSEVVPLVKSLQPELVLLDLNIAWEHVCDLLDAIRGGPTRTIVMVDSLDNARAIEALQHGAHGIVPRRTSAEVLIKSIQTVMAGDFWISREILTDLIQLFRRIASTPMGQDVLGPLTEPKRAEVPQSAPKQSTSVEFDSESCFGLTPRELQVIQVVADGQTNKDIAGTLGISEYTVKHHLTNIFDKLGVYNRVELVLYALNNGLSQQNSKVS